MLISGASKNLINCSPGLSYQQRPANSRLHILECSSLLLLLLATPDPVGL